VYTGSRPKGRDPGSPQEGAHRAEREKVDSDGKGGDTADLKKVAGIKDRRSLRSQQQKKTTKKKGGAKKRLWVGMQKACKVCKKNQRIRSTTQKRRKKKEGERI